jgi:cyclopropane-fatty-acyl-phospholipid synthase
MALYEKFITKLVDEVNEINGGQIVGVKLPNGFTYPDKAKNYVVVKNSKWLKRFLKNPEMAFGEGYTEGDIEIEGKLEEVLVAGLRYLQREEGKSFFLSKVLQLFSHLAGEDDEKNIQYHYDIGNEFYKLWLDESMTYSCAFFPTKDTGLEEAQRKKREISLKKLLLNENDTLLDIGCGWGSVLFDAVEKFNVRKAVGCLLYTSPSPRD